MLGLQQPLPNILLGGILGTLLFLAFRTSRSSRGGAGLIPLVGSAIAALAVLLWSQAGSNLAILFASAALAMLLALLLIFGTAGA